MALDPAALPPAVEAFLAERHLATLTTLRPDGSPHVVPVGFMWDRAAGLVRILALSHSRKVRNLEAAPGSRAVVCQVDGRRWLTLEGAGRVSREPETLALTLAAYATRYRPPRDHPDRVTIEIAVDRVLGQA